MFLFTRTTLYNIRVRSASMGVYDGTYRFHNFLNEDQVIKKRCHTKYIDISISETMKRGGLYILKWFFVSSGPNVKTNNHMFLGKLPLYPFPNQHFALSEK